MKNLYIEDKNMGLSAEFEDKKKRGIKFGI